MRLHRNLLGILPCLLPLLCIQATPYGNLEDLYNPDYEDYDENNEVSEEADDAVLKPPGFVSSSVDLVVNEGETIRLPCIVTRLQGFVLMWKKNGNIISVGNQILGNADSRYNLESKENGNNLVISLSELTDEGEYVCQVSAFKPTQIHHTVKIRVRPKITTTPEKSITVKEGDDVRFLCSVLEGHPEPRLIWRKKGARMPSGELEMAGGDIVMEAVSRHHAGTYQCVTRDDYGLEPVTKEVELFVEYAPVIEQEQTHIKTSAGEEIHITCIVHAFPSPHVTWTKDGRTMSENSKGVVMNQAANRYNLILLVVNKNYYGEYGCQAANALGVASKSLQVSAYAEEAQINPVPLAVTPWLVQIEWTAKSETPITIFRVQFMAVDAEDWSEVDVTSTQLTSGVWYGKAELDTLRPSTQYMVQVSSLNNEGYSKFSEVTFFTTSKEENYTKEAISTGSPASCNFMSGVLSLMTIIVLVIS